MTVLRRHVLHLAAGAVALPAISRLAWAETYPSQPVRVIVGFAAGGPNDILARLIGHWLAKRLGARSSSRTGRALAATSPPRRSCTHPPTVTRCSWLARQTPSMRHSTTGSVSISCATSRPSRASCAVLLSWSYTVGSDQDAPRVHRVCQGESGQAVIRFRRRGRDHAHHGRTVQNDDRRRDGARALSRRVTRVERPARRTGAGLFANPAQSIPYIGAGKLHALAITTATRSEALPDVPTVGEFVPGYEASSFFGFGAPKNTPAETIDRLNKEINAGLADPGTKARLADMDGTALVGSPADFAKLIAEATDKWGNVIRAANIKPE